MFYAYPNATLVDIGTGIWAEYSFGPACFYSIDFHVVGGFGTSAQKAFFRCGGEDDQLFLVRRFLSGRGCIPQEGEPPACGMHPRLDAYPCAKLLFHLSFLSLLGLLLLLLGRIRGGCGLPRRGYAKWLDHTAHANGMGTPAAFFAFHVALCFWAIHQGTLRLPKGLLFLRSMENATTSASTSLAVTGWSASRGIRFGVSEEDGGGRKDAAVHVAFWMRSRGREANPSTQGQSSVNTDVKRNNNRALQFRFQSRREAKPFHFWYRKNCEHNKNYKNCETM